MTFKDTSSNYNGKELKTVLKLDDEHDVIVSIYYSPEYRRVTNSYGVSFNEQTGKHVARLNVNKMRNEGNFRVGGIGTTTTVGQPVARQTIKGLWDIADKLDEMTIKGLAVGQTAEPSLIV